MSAFEVLDRPLNSAETQRAIEAIVSRLEQIEVVCGEGFPPPIATSGWSSAPPVNIELVWSWVGKGCALLGYDTPFVPDA